MNEVYILFLLSNIPVSPNVLAVYGSFDAAKKGIQSYVDGGTLRIDEKFDEADDVYKVNASMKNGQTEQDKLYGKFGQLIRRNVEL